MGCENNKREIEGNVDEPVGKKQKAYISNMECNTDISEIYSPPRITTVARRYGLRAGCSLDITTFDVDGRPWDFDDVEMRNRAIRKIVQEKPYVVITSPMCTDLSIMMNTNWGKLGQTEKGRRLSRARMHLRFACTLHLIQHKAGRYFIHEHPRTASSWREPCVTNVVRTTGTVFTHLDQCMYGLTSEKMVKLHQPRSRRHS